MTKVYDFSKFFVRALNNRDVEICADAIKLIFPGEKIELEDLELDHKPGKCPYMEDLSVWCRGKLIMKRTSKTSTGFMQEYESPIFKTKSSKSK